MNKEKVMEKVIQAVVHVQEVSGRATGVVGSGTRPIGGAEGFDSLSGIEATIILSESLGHELADDNLFVSEDGHRALSIAEVTDKVSKAIAAETNNQ